MIEFSQPLADARNYPSPTILGLPSEQFSGENSRRLLPQGVGDSWVLDRGRSALYILAKSIKAKRVWCPAYHCPALVEPFLAAGKHVSFYAVTEDLQPDFTQLEQELQAGDVIIAVRYFGFDCGVQMLASLCRKKDASLIEDLAHAMYAGQLYGVAAITSMVKFLPVNSGAELLISEDFKESEQVQKLIDDLPNLYLERLKKLFGKVSNKLGFKTKQSNFRYFVESNVSKNLMKADQALITSYIHESNKSKRRDNYQYLAKRLKHCELGHLIYPSLPENIVPYVLPFMLRHEASFDYIRRQGLQIYRWEELASSSCENSLSFRTKLIQIPVHQSLTQQDLDCICSILNSSDKG